MSSVDNAAATPWHTRIRQILSWLIGLGLLAWLLHKLPLASLPHVLKQVSLSVWLQALGGLILSYALRASRMQWVLIPGAQRFWADAKVWRVLLLYNAALNILPFRGGELSFPWFAARHLNLSIDRSVAAWLWMRIQDVAVLALLGFLLWPDLGIQLRVVGSSLWLLGIVLLGPISRWLLQTLLPTAVDPVKSAVNSSEPAKWRTIAQGLQSALAEKTHHHPVSWLYTLANWLVKLAAGAALIGAVCGADLMSAWAGALGGELIVILPIQGPAGFGTYEAGVAAGMTWFNQASALTVSPHAAALGALCWHITMLASALLGGLLAGWKKYSSANSTGAAH